MTDIFSGYIKVIYKSKIKPAISDPKTRRVGITIGNKPDLFQQNPKGVTSITHKTQTNISPQTGY